MNSPHRLIALATGLTLFAACGSVLAQQDYPNKPIRMIIPFPPGGGTDIVSRQVAAKMSEGLGQQVIVDNRPGAGGTVGAELAVGAAPDGYTIIMVSAAIANVRDIAVAGRANLLRSQRFNRQGVAVEGHKFDFEGFPVAMHMNDYAQIAGFKTCRRQWFGQLRTCKL